MFIYFFMKADITPLYKHNASNIWLKIEIECHVMYCKNSQYGNNARNEKSFFISIYIFSFVHITVF